MRWQLASTFALTAMSAACYGPNTVDCGNGYLCPEGSSCAEPGTCGAPLLVDQCFGQDRPAFAACTFSEEDGNPEPGVCQSGVCTSCSVTPDFAGCGRAEWSPMRSPVPTIDLFSLWVVPPDSAVPVTHAYAGGLEGLLLEYDGRAWNVSAGPTTMQTLGAIWGSGESDIYAVGATSLFHFDGAGWADITSQLPTAIDGFKDVTGSSATDVYVVGLTGQIAHFDGTAWTVMAVGTVTWNAAIVNAGALAAAGSSGTILVNNAATKPLPSSYSTARLNDVFVNGDILTVAGADAATGLVTLFEMSGGTWTNVGPLGLSGINLITGWRNFVAGQSGEILRRGASEWTAFPTTPGENELRSMSGAGNEVFVVGAGGAIWRYAEI